VGRDGGGIPSVLIIFSFLKKMVSMGNEKKWIFASIFIVLFDSIVITLIEPETFTNVIDGFWWTIVTMSTVGYGDFFPETALGKLFAIVFVIFPGLVIISKAIETLIKIKRMKEEGRLKFTKSGHYVIVGWNKKVKISIEELIKDDETRVVIIDNDVEKSPYEHRLVHFVKGDPTDAGVLEKANIKEAKSVIIFTKNNEHMSTHDADASTLMTALAIEKENPNIKTVVELADRRHKSLFSHLHIDKFIGSNEIISKIAVMSSIGDSGDEIILDLISRKDGLYFHNMKKKKHWRTYNDAIQELIQKGAVLIAKDKQTNKLKNPGELIPDDEVLVIMCDDETFEMIK
jgi:voltage-gated potassium channel